MSAPPCFTDLGKSTRDLFSKGYHVGMAKLDFKTKTKEGVEFNMNGTCLNDTGKVNAAFDTKWKMREYPITLQEKWNTDNNLTTIATVEESGIKFALNAGFAPQTGKKNASANLAYKHELVHVTGDSDLNSTTPVVTGTACLKLSTSAHVGGLLAYDSAKRAITKANLGVSLAPSDEWSVHAYTESLKLFGLNLHNKANEKVDWALSLSYNKESSDPSASTQFGLGCIYKYDKGITLRAKVNHAANVGVSFAHRLRDGITLTYSAAIDTRNLNQGGHKLGLGIELES